MVIGRIVPYYQCTPQRIINLIFYLIFCIRFLQGGGGHWCEFKLHENGEFACVQYLNYWTGNFNLRSASIVVCSSR